MKKLLANRFIVRVWKIDSSKCWLKNKWPKPWWRKYKHSISFFNHACFIRDSWMVPFWFAFCAQIRVGNTSNYFNGLSFSTLIVKVVLNWTYFEELVAISDRKKNEVLFKRICVHTGCAEKFNHFWMHM